MVTAYHEVSKESLGDVLKHGLKRVSRGEKSDDQIIYKTDQFLDNRRSNKLAQAEVSRDNNVYAYVAIDDHILDITDGKLVAVSRFIHKSEQCVLRLSLDPTKCFVSDLDTYDRLKQAIKNNESLGIQEDLAKKYWTKVLPFYEYNRNKIYRAEIMVTYDIPPENIKHVQ
jgi:hypothetical protein